MRTWAPAAASLPAALQVRNKSRRSPQQDTGAPQQPGQPFAAALPLQPSPPLRLEGPLCRQGWLLGLFAPSSSGANSVMTLRASGFVVLSSSAADGRVPGLVLLLFFCSRALKSSFLLEDFPLLPAAAARDSPVGEPEVFTGEWEVGRLLKVSPGSFRPRTFLLDLGTKGTQVGAVWGWGEVPERGAWWCPACSAGAR